MFPIIAAFSAPVLRCNAGNYDRAADRRKPCISAAEVVSTLCLWRLQSRVLLRNVWSRRYCQPPVTRNSIREVRTRTMVISELKKICQCVHTCVLFACVIHRFCLKQEDRNSDSRDIYDCRLLMNRGTSSTFISLKYNQCVLQNPLPCPSHQTNIQHAVRL